VQWPSAGEYAAASNPSVEMSGDRRPASPAVIMRLGTPRAFCRATLASKAVTASGELSRNRYPTWWKSISWPNRAGKSRNVSRLRAPSAMFTGSENCARTPPAAFDVEPAPRASRSRTTMSRIPRLASW
jgi:hypothetical protein